MSEQDVEQAFEDLEAAFEKLNKALGGEFALGSLLMAGGALKIVRKARLEHGRYQELGEQLAHTEELAQAD